MKKQMLTRQDIVSDLILKLNKRKSAAIYVTVLLCVSAAFCVWFAVLFACGNAAQLEAIYESPIMSLIIGIFIMMIFAIFLFRNYYYPLYIIKTSKFMIIEGELRKKEKALVSYYRRTERENLLHFECGRIAVENEVYSSSEIGDSFYIVLLKPDTPFFVYPKKHYMIDGD